METKNWNPTPGKKFNIKKDQSVNMPEGLTSIKFGLGWTSKCDIDASIILMDASGKKLEVIYYGNKVSNGRAVVHDGDNTTGDGAGDDEVITINFVKLKPNVDSIWPVITIYTAKDQFDDVSGAYGRIFDAKTEAEFIKFDLSANKDNISNGNILANFKRNGNNWTFKARGYYTKGTRTANDIAPICS